MLSGFIRFSSSRMPSDSSWNTPLASPRCKQLVGLRVVERQLVQVDLDAARLLDQLDGVVEQRQRAQAEEVHLEQADLFQVAHDPLRRDDRARRCLAAVVALADDALQRHVIGQRRRWR